jgi:protocatechuate 3,4-dioxygenase beta subunit
VIDHLNRRQVLAGFGSVSLAALLAACGADDGSNETTTAEVGTTGGDTATVAPKTSSRLADVFDDSSACALTPQETEGPYYFDANSIRSDIREDREGVLLRLAMRVRDEDCEPLRNAVVDIWHCDADGVYSGFESASPGPPGQGGSSRTDGEKFLRGAQVTNADGIVEFKTIYPGWYRGRTTHIHAKVHVDNSTVLTTQLFFDEAVNAAVYRRAPYSSHTGREMFNGDDSIFDERLLLDLSKEGSGYLGVISFDVA